jgi:transposase
MDANNLCGKIEAQGGAVTISPRRHCMVQREYNRIARKIRWRIEGSFAKLKLWRRNASHYDKHAANFLGFVKRASIMLRSKRLDYHYSLVKQA